MKVPRRVISLTNCFTLTSQPLDNSSLKNHPRNTISISALNSAKKLFSGPWHTKFPAAHHVNRCNRQTFLWRINFRCVYVFITYRMGFAMQGKFFTLLVNRSESNRCLGTEVATVNVKVTINIFK